MGASSYFLLFPCKIEVRLLMRNNSMCSNSGVISVIYSSPIVCATIQSSAICHFYEVLIAVSCPASETSLAMDKCVSLAEDARTTCCRCCASAAGCDDVLGAARFVSSWSREGAPLAAVALAVATSLLRVKAVIMASAFRGWSIGTM